MTAKRLSRHLRWHYPVVRQKRRLLLASFPKSGSTYLARFLAKLIEGDIIFGGQIPSRNEQDIAPFWLWSAQSRNIVAHMHTRYSVQTEVYLKHFGMEPIVCVRNLADVIPSIVDHWRAESGFDGANWPFAHVHPYLMQQDDKILFEFVAVHVIPWYVNFYASWVRARRGPVVAYDDIFSEDRTVLFDLAQQLGFSDDQARVAIRAANTQATRLNVGKSGRGAKLPQSIHDKIGHAVSFYPDIDWAPVWPNRVG